MAAVCPGLARPDGGCPRGDAGRPAERPRRCCLIPFVALSLQRDKTPSSSKKVTFGLNRNMTAGECGGAGPDLVPSQKSRRQAFGGAARVGCGGVSLGPLDGVCLGEDAVESPLEPGLPRTLKAVLVWGTDGGWPGVAALGATSQGRREEGRSHLVAFSLAAVGLFCFVNRSQTLFKRMQCV